MSDFEFVLVPLAIVIGFAISEVLKGWGQQVRSRHRREWHPIQLASSAFILFFCMVYLWALWLARDVEWTFPLYLLIAIPGFAAALAAYISRVDTSIESAPTLDQYFENSRPIYILLAVFPVAIIAISIMSGARTLIPAPPNIWLVTLVRLILLGLIATMAWSKSSKVHLAALSILWIMIIGVVIRVTLLAEMSI